MHCRLDKLDKLDMLTNNLKIFDNINLWEKNKNHTLFSNKFDLDFYQQYFLKELLNNRKFYSPLKLTSSGTTSNQPKKINFPKELYNIVENHHIWRIMNSHDIEPGNVVRIFQASVSRSEIKGPIKNSSLGLCNNSWEIIYNPFDIEENFWKNNIDFLIKLKPKFLYTSPSVFMSFYKNIENKFEFPVVFSCETLVDSTRNLAKDFFSKAIDKMRDWSTGFGFFECNKHNRHVYDELCFINQVENKKIKCTDFFNYCDKIIEKDSDDVVLFEQKKCDCGLYGNIIKEFEGKTFEVLVSINNKKYSCNFISNLFNKIKQDLASYEIVQKEDKSIEFNSINKLDNKIILEISNLLGFLVMDDGNQPNIYYKEKLLFESNSSNISFRFDQKKYNIYRNKKISLRSFVKIAMYFFCFRIDCLL